MNFSEELRHSIKELSILIRQVYGIREKERISYREHPLFVKDVIRDFSNISQNLAVADNLTSEQEVELFTYIMEKIFYADGDVNHKFLQSVSYKFKNYESESPSIESPILILEKAKKYDSKNNQNIEPLIRALVVEYAEAMVMSDGFESVGEFDVLETFKTWVNNEG